MGQAQAHIKIKIFFVGIKGSMKNLSHLGNFLVAQKFLFSGFCTKRFFGEGFFSGIAMKTLCLRGVDAIEEPFLVSQRAFL